MNGGDNADQEIEPDAIAGLKTHVNGFPADPRDSCGTVWFVVKRIVHVVRQLTMNTYRLHASQHRVT